MAWGYGLMQFPADNVFVDMERKVVETFRKYLKSLEPASRFSEATVTALLALLNATAETETDPPSQGSIPYQGLSEATTLPLGTPGQVLGVNDQATAPEWQDAAARILIEAKVPTFSGSVVFSNIPAIYRELHIEVAGVIFQFSASLGIEVSGDGTNYGIQVAISSASTGVIEGTAQLRGYTLPSRYSCCVAAILASNGTSFAANAIANKDTNGATNAVQTIRFADAAGSVFFTAVGEIRLYGIK